jgi:uncharacterized protein (TIGR00251 family)
VSSRRVSLATLEVRVQPGARANEITGFEGAVLRVRVTARPEKGAANEAVIELIAKRLGIAKTRITLVRGTASRTKVLGVEGLDLEAVRALVGRGAEEDA